jgi:hypothetical protein
MYTTPSIEKRKPIMTERYNKNEVTSDPDSGTIYLHNVRGYQNLKTVSDVKLEFEQERGHPNYCGLKRVQLFRDEYNDENLVLSAHHETTDHDACLIVFEMIMAAPDEWWVS